MDDKVVDDEELRNSNYCIDVGADYIRTRQLDLRNSNWNNIILASALNMVSAANAAEYRFVASHGIRAPIPLFNLS